MVNAKRLSGMRRFSPASRAPPAAFMERVDIMRAKGFTLVEILIVVLIPGHHRRDQLCPSFPMVRRRSRQACWRRSSRHSDPVGGFSKGSTRALRRASPIATWDKRRLEASFIDHMTKSSDASGATAAPGTSGYNYGPYLREVPTNPVNGLNTVLMCGGHRNDSRRRRPVWLDLSTFHIELPGRCSGQDENGRRILSIDVL